MCTLIVKGMKPLFSHERVSSSDSGSDGFFRRLMSLCLIAAWVVDACWPGTSVTQGVLISLLGYVLVSPHSFVGTVEKSSIARAYQLLRFLDTVPIIIIIIILTQRRGEPDALME